MLIVQPTGASGLLIGGAAGIVRSSTPGLFALASGLQCAALGTTYYASRAAILQAWHITSSSPPSDRVYPSALAGGITGGAIGGLTSMCFSSSTPLPPPPPMVFVQLTASIIAGGRANIIPGMIMFTLFGYAGQHLYNRIDARKQHSSAACTDGDDAANSSAAQPTMVTERPLWRRILDSRYSPMKVLSDDEYEEMLREKMVRVDAEIAIVDEAMEKMVQNDEKEKQARQGKKEGD
ncbi:MAG: hypothetical protein Q9220_000714 [cf. Caloplaca sp. 1 TL-2023]